MKQTGTVNGVWSRITYQNDDGTEAEGYIPTSCLDLPDAVTEEADTIDKDKDAGTLHESSGEGVFADALEDVDPGVSVETESDRNTGCGIFRRKSAGSRRI